MQEYVTGKRNGAYRHGMEGTPTYKSWIDMKARCLNPRNHAYSSYGGRGITVCDRWRDFVAFLEDMGVCPEGKTLDRIDNDGHYEPGNCRWATRAEQQRNRRITVLNTEAVKEIRASDLPSTVLGPMYGVSPRTIRKVRSGDRWAS